VFFPHFIRERLIRDLITINFHDRAMPVREHIDQVFAAAKIMEYAAGEQDLVDRVVMNLQPHVLAQSAFLERPHSRKGLYVVGLIEKIAVDKERQRNLSSQVATTREEPRSSETARNVSAHSRPPKSWACGRVRHVQRHCHRKTSQSGNGQGPGGPRTTAITAFRKVVATPASPLLWVTLSLKERNIPAIVDTGAQFSCVRSDVIEYLYLTGEPCIFFRAT